MIRRATAALAAVAAVVAVAAPAASAQDTEVEPVISQPYHPCLTQITVPNCVNWALDETEDAVLAVQRTYNEDVQPKVDGQTCKVHYILTGEPCPTYVPILP